MSAAKEPLVEVDWSTFNPWRIRAVKHRLASHPLLHPEQLIELGKRLEKVGRVRTHSSEATAGTPFNEAPRLNPNRRSAEETLTRIKEARAWMSLLNVQTDDIYRKLVDEVLDTVRPGTERVDPGMCYRGGWIFVTSPNTVTPFHMDKEHNFILQVRGRKRLYVWEHDDTVVVSDAARDLFHATHSRDLVVWKDEFRQRATVFELEPGQGAYMPSTSPHMVENLDEPSITASFTYYTEGTRRRELLHRVHQKLRARGITPPAIGASPLQDAALHLVARGFVAGKNRLRRLAGRPVHTNREEYALALVS